ncbi:RDD family protein [Flavobacterium sp. J372]|uniref:RDD family protein n=1 Tax=Flavobacterium sp. J372 TaxID=2898436 RepID=UPI002151DD8C|nr:RDD family protein [Flavobacterium sp. J372]MCR5861813.1 RDD family protein [Flavobacterium sp. J372]
MSELSITTTQNVNINFNAAGVGERVLAYIFDAVIKTAYSLIIYLVVYEYFGLEKFVAPMDFWSQAAIMIILYLPCIFYTLVLESVFQGQTIGKRLMRIRVIKIDGYEAGFGDHLMRWLCRLVDIFLLLNTGIVGLGFMLATDKTQRLGDLAAGTAVISLKNDISIDHTILREVESDYRPIYPLVIKLTDNDIRIIKETYEHALKAADFEQMQKLQDKVIQVTGIKSVSQNATAFIDTLLNDYNYYTQKM